MVGVAYLPVRARPPHEQTVGAGFPFREHVSGRDDGPPWMQPSVLLAGNIARAFAKDGVPFSFTGPHRAPGPGEFEPPWWQGPRASYQWRPLFITKRREYELMEQGFIGWLDMWDGPPAFMWAGSAHRPRIFENTPEGKERETSYRLRTYLPYSMYLLRFAAHLRAIARAHQDGRGAILEPADLEAELNAWLQRHTRAHAPESFWLERAHAELTTLDGQPAFTVTLRPWHRYMRAPYTLELTAPLHP
jgi:type VI secretion system protein ImpC